MWWFSNESSPKEVKFTFPQKRKKDSATFLVTCVLAVFIVKPLSISGARNWVITTWSKQCLQWCSQCDLLWHTFVCLYFVPVESFKLRLCGQKTFFGGGGGRFGGFQSQIHSQRMWLKISRLISFPDPSVSKTSEMASFLCSVNLIQRQKKIVLDYCYFFPFVSILASLSSVRKTPLSIA